MDNTGSDLGGTRTYSSADLGAVCARKKAAVLNVSKRP